MIPDTQREAFEAIKPKRETLQEQVFQFIKERGGATDEEIRANLVGSYGLAARRNELANQGRVVDNGKRRLSSFGRKVIVWEVCP